MTNVDNRQSTSESKEDYARSHMESYVKDCKIFIDTCSLLHFAADKFWINIIPLLGQYNNKVIIPLRSIEELEKRSNKNDKPELSENAKQMLKIVQQLIKAGFVDIRGEKTDNFADNVFQVVFTKFRMTHKLLLITQDNDLSKDIIALNGNKSVRANSVHVKRINQYGYLSNFSWNDGSKDCNKSANHVYDRHDLPEEEIYRLSTKVTNVEDMPLKVIHIPGEQETVYTQSGAIKLLKSVAAGGEGIIYTTNTQYAAKIYKKENITKRKHEKIKLMLSKQIKYEGICYPVAILSNSNREFVGFLMPLGKGKELQKSLFIKPLLVKNFPNWRKRDTVELAITILKKIKYLHDRNIIMGDINPANILVVSPKEVYLVDTDSYQVEGFPCPVGTINYTAPEIQRKHFANFLRTLGNENFAVATLLFMIMLPGKPPYSQQGGENPIDNIIRMDFSYPFGDSSNKKTPDGPWRYIWSHLTYDLKEAFYNTFRKDGENATEKERLSVNEWLSIFEYFLELLDSGKYGKQDKMSEELFPTRHKKSPKVDYTTCKLCGNEVAENQCQNGMCIECLKKGEVYRCKKCGKEILHSNYQKYVKNAKRYNICPECFEHGNHVKVIQYCTDCGNSFEITNNEHDFYKKKGFDLPKRCKKCRDTKKNRSYSNTQSYQNISSSSHSKSSSSNSRGNTGSLCFISTAVCDYLGKQDECEELVALRNFRDNWLQQQPDGQSIIAEYYNCAPLLVSKLKCSEHYSEYCQILWNDYIQPCLQLIQEDLYDDCKNKYHEMVKHLNTLLL